MTAEQSPTMSELLSRLPWWHDLTQTHRQEMVAVIESRMSVVTSKVVYAKILEDWQVVAERDAKWARFEFLRESGILEPGKID